MGFHRGFMRFFVGFYGIWSDLAGIGWDTWPTMIIWVCLKIVIPPNSTLTGKWDGIDDKKNPMVSGGFRIRIFFPRLFESFKGDMTQLWIYTKWPMRHKQLMEIRIVRGQRGQQHQSSLSVESGRCMVVFRPVFDKYLDTIDIPDQSWGFQSLQTPTDRWRVNGESVDFLMNSPNIVDSASPNSMWQQKQSLKLMPMICLTEMTEMSVRRYVKVPYIPGGYHEWSRYFHVSLSPEICSTGFSTPARTD